MISLRAIAITLILTAAATAAQNVTEYPSRKIKKGESLVIHLDTALRFQSAEVRGAVSSNPAHGNARWCAELADAAGHPLCCATVSWGETGFDDTFSRRYLRLTIDTADTAGRFTNAAIYDRYKNVDLHRGANSLVIDLADTQASFAIGSDMLVHAGTASLPRPAASVTVTSDRTLRVDHAALKSYPQRRHALVTEWDARTVATHLASPAGKHPIEGYWTFLDRDNDPAWAIPGGFYTLAIVRSRLNPETFDILYISGARTAASLWHPYMLKGVMRPTPFQDHYTMQWFDASQNDAGPECSADLQNSTILQLNFPLHHAKIRFSRASTPLQPLIH